MRKVIIKSALFIMGGVTCTLASTAQTVALEVDRDANSTFYNKTVNFRQNGTGELRSYWNLTDGYFSFHTKRSNYSTAFRVSVPSLTSVAYTVYYASGSRDNFYVMGSGLACSREGFYDYSDAKLKKNIVTVNGALNKVMKMRGVNYSLITDSEYLQAEAEQTETSSAVDPVVIESIKKEHNERKHTGFIAQEVEKICPEAVRTMHDGLKAINYSALIPVLVEAIKEQQEQIGALQVQASASVSLLQEIDDLKKQLEKCCEANTNSGKLKNTNTSALSNESSAELSQQLKPELFANAPNPFKESTEIKMTIPASVEFASLAIYDLNGRQLKAVSIADRGAVSVTIESNELMPGMYLYSLLADGQLVDTKTMVVTE